MTHSCKDECSYPLRTATRGTLKADVVVGAHASVALLLVDAPETFLQAGVDHFPSVRGCHPVCGASLHGHGPCADPLPVIESDRFQAFVVPVPSRVVDVEPRGPLCHPWSQMQGWWEGERQKTKQFNCRMRNKGGREVQVTNQHGRVTGLRDLLLQFKLTSCTSGNILPSIF